MRIAVLTLKFPIISETFVLNQITGLLDRGHEVEIIAREKGSLETMHSDVMSYGLLDRTTYLTTPQSRVQRIIEASKIIGKLLTRQAKALVPVINHLLRFDVSKALRLAFDLGPLVGRPKYDVIHCHFGPAGELGRSLRKIGVLEGPLITTFYGYDITSFLKEHGERYYYDLFREGDLFLYLSDFIGKKLIRAGCPSRKSFRFRLGTDLRQFSFSERHVRPGEVIRLLTVARLVEKKGLEYSIKAVAQLIKTHPSLKYDIVGEGPLHGELSNLIHELEVQDKIKLLGYRNKDEVRALYAEAHIFLLTSVTSSNGDEEGQGVVLQEAQAMGLPVVCTNHNGFPESIMPGESGFLVPEREVDAIVHQVSELIKNPQRWAEIGQKGRRFVEREFDLNKRTDALVEVYQKLIREASPSVLFRHAGATNGHIADASS